MRHSLRTIALLAAAFGPAAFGPAASARADDWPEWMGARRDGVWRENGLVAKFPKGGPKVLWRTPLGPGYSGPSVAGGRVYVMDRRRAVAPDGSRIRPTKEGIAGDERIVCLDQATGKVVWEHSYNCAYQVSYPSGPRTTPLVRGGKVWTLGTMGDLLCLDAATGKVLWSKNLAKEYKVDSVQAWGYAASPLLDGNTLYLQAGGEGAAVVALDKDTGKELWKALDSKEVGYSPPMIYEVGGKRQLIVWLSESLNALDPATGKPLWAVQYPAGREPQRPAVNIIPVRPDGDLLFISTFYHGPMMVKLDTDKPGATVLWKGKSNNPGKPDGMHCLMAAPVFKDGCVFGVSAMGQLYCQDEHTGKILWDTLQPVGGKEADCGTAFLIPQGDRFVLFNDAGELILAELSPKGYKEIDRAKILDPVQAARGRQVVWSHPAFAGKCVFARNDKEIVCVSLAQDPS